MTRGKITFVQLLSYLIMFILNLKLSYKLVAVISRLRSLLDYYKINLSYLTIIEINQSILTSLSTDFNLSFINRTLQRITESSF